jgi:hypothetical protein
VANAEPLLGRRPQHFVAIDSRAQACGIQAVLIVPAV